MQDRTLCLAFLGAVLIGICNGVPVITDEAEATNFVNSFNDQMVNHTFSEGDKYLETALKVIIQLMTTRFKDKELQYISDRMRKTADEAVVGNAKQLRMLEALDELDALATTEDIPSYGKDDVLVSYIPDVESLIARSNDSNELQYYWTKWRDINREEVQKSIVDIVNITREAANFYDMTPFDFWMRDYNITEMENVMTQIEPLYKQLHAFIRQQLRNKYGDKAIESNGPIPDHLFEQVLAQVWTDDSIIDDMYPYNDLPDYDKIIETDVHDTLELYKIADKFYQSLGFQPIPDDFWGTQIKMIEEKDDVECEETISDMTSNVHMEYCQDKDFDKLLQAYGDMGRLYYAKEKKDLPAYYFPSYDLEYSIGEAVILSASTPKHLTATGMVTDFQFTDEVLMNRLLRMGIHTLMNIPVYFVHTKVMADLFSGVVCIDDLNKHYWKLMGTYVGVEPPVIRKTISYDFPYDFFIDLNRNGQAKNFNAEVLGHQLYERFCEISGQDPSGPLENCDFYDNKNVGDAMKKMMKLGSSKEFKEVLAALLPENPSINAESLLDYYQPMETWLTEKNLENNVTIGWIPSTKNIARSRCTKSEGGGE